MNVPKPKYKIGDIVVIRTAMINYIDDEGKRGQLRVIGGGWINYYLNGKGEEVDEAYIYTEDYRQFKIESALTHRYHKSDEFDEWNYGLEVCDNSDWVENYVDESEVEYKLTI